MNWTVLVGMIVLFSIILGPSIWRMSRRSAAVRHRAESVMHGREPMTPQQFAEWFFPQGERVVAAGVREALANVLIVDAARVSPNDYLVGDLGLGQVDGLEPHHLDSELRTRFGISVLSLFERGDPSVRLGISAFPRKPSFRTPGDSTPQRYIVDGQMVIVPHDRCPSCWQVWDFKWKNPRCQHCDSALGENTKILLDHDLCPMCEEGKVSMSSPTCDKCGYLIDARTVEWG